MGRKNREGWLKADIHVGDEYVGTVDLMPTKFRTGSVGYRMNGKIEFDGKRYQVGGNVVEIYSKPAQQVDLAGKVVEKAASTV